jgi:pimeloyl-ACP methyl ester carboxylesterase
MSMKVSSPSPAPRGAMVDIGEGRALHAVFAGPLSSPWPLVILEAGAFGFSADWAAIQAKLTAIGMRSMAYDRAGLGFSPPGPSPRDGLAVRADLEALLAATGEAGPFLYCGHSMAGLHAAMFAATNRDRLAGVVLVDATTPAVTDSRLAGILVDLFAGLSGAAAWGSRRGLFAPYAWAGVGDTIGLEGDPSTEKRWAFSHPGHNQWAAEEVASWKQTAREAAKTPFDPDLPVAVILAGGPSPATSARALQTLPARASRFGYVEQEPGASHATLLNTKHGDAIVRGIVHARDAGVTAPDRPAAAAE